MVIDFKKISHNFSPLVDGNDLRVTDCAKILGVTTSSDLKWNNPLNDIVNFYCTTIRPVLSLVKYSSLKIALKTARDGEKNMTHDSVNIFFKLLSKNLL